MSFLDRIRACSEFEPANYLPFRVAAEEVGYVTPEFAKSLSGFAHVFNVGPRGVDLANGLKTPDVRSKAVEEALRELFERGLIEGWRDEPYPVAAGPASAPLLFMERAAAPLFGIYVSGVHVNGFVGRGAGMRMWVGRRSFNKPTAPGKLDQIVAGGKSAHYSIFDTLLKESDEEANIPADLAAQSRPVGAITYCTARREGLRRDVLYTFDLELPDDFTPRNNDDEISEFYLWPIGRVIETVRETNEFKFNCALIVIDFLIRHGFIDHDEPDYLDLVRGLHAF